MRHTRTLAALLVLAGCVGLSAQATVVVTTVMPAPRLPLSAARDLLFDLDSGALVAQAAAGIDGSFPIQGQRAVLSADGRFIVGASMRLPITVPISYPISYRDLWTGAAGAIGTDASKVAAHPLRPVVYVGFWNGDVGRLDAGGLSRRPVCDPGNTPSAIAVSRDGAEVYAACFSSLRVLDGVTLAEARRFTLAASPSEMHAVAGNRLFTLDLAGPIVFAIMEMSVYDLASGSRLASAPTPIDGRGLSWAVPSPDGHHVIVGVGSSVVTYDATPYVIDSETAEVVGAWPIDRVTKVAFLASGDRAVLLREVSVSPDLDPRLNGVLLDVGARSIVAEMPVGLAGYPGMSSLLVLEPPYAPDTLTAEVTGSRVTLLWTMPEASRVATDFIIEAGASPTSFGLLSQRLGSDLQTVVVPNVPSGAYFVRVRALNATGVGPPSPVVQVFVP